MIYLANQAGHEVDDKAFLFEQTPCSDVGKFDILGRPRLLLCHLAM